MAHEVALQFDCQGQALSAISHQVDTSPSLGVLIVLAGGPQYRVGVSRQFVNLGRHLRQQEIPCFRFDHRGVGISDGDCKGFIDMHEDIRCAIDAFMALNPTMQGVVLWGECESATAAAFYGYQDDRVKGLFLANPWIRTEEGQAKTYMKHYYRQKLTDKQFWKKLISGKFDLVGSARSFLQNARTANKRSKPSGVDKMDSGLTNLPLPQRLEKSTERFNGPIHILTSGKDFIAQEFSDYVNTSTVWKKIYRRTSFTSALIADADHSFSRAEWRSEMFDQVVEFVARCK